MSRARLSVLMSFPAPSERSNPFGTLLVGAVESTGDVVVQHFSWRSALLGRYDVFHVHWPELLFRGRGPLRTWSKRLLGAALIGRIRVMGTPVVRTVHNIAPHESGGRTERLLLRAVDHSTTVRVVLNDQTPTPPGAPVELIVHGHYRDWYDLSLLPGARAGEVGFFGRIRPYKGLEELIAAYRQVPQGVPPTHLTIMGALEAPALAEQLTELAHGDPRIGLDFGFVTDSDLVRLVGRCQLVVLPYTDMHNSGAALAALSLGRPVLVPDNPVTRQMLEEFGDPWIQTFHPPLAPGDLVAAVARVGDLPQGSIPAMDSREWDAIGRDHVRVYRRAIKIMSRE